MIRACSMQMADLRPQPACGRPQIIPVPDCADIRENHPLDVAVRDCCLVNRSARRVCDG